MLIASLSVILLLRSLISDHSLFEVLGLVAKASYLYIVSDWLAIERMARPVMKDTCAEGTSLLSVSALNNIYSITFIGARLC